MTDSSRVKKLVEIGCGKGYFIEMLLKKGYDIIGFDPAYEGDNPRIIKKFYCGESNIKVDGIILRHVLEHIPDPIKFLLMLKESNSGGLVYIEVPCLDWIVTNRAWFDIHYEHVNYFRLSDFYLIFSKLVDTGHLFGGQYLYVVAELNSLRYPSSDEIVPFEFPNDFTYSVGFFADRIKRSGRKSAVWGAASKGVIFSLFMHRNGARLEYVIDINPSKQGLFLPVTGIRVISPQEAMSKLPEGSDIYVMNSNYLEEIRQITNNRYNYLRVENG